MTSEYPPSAASAASTFVLLATGGTIAGTSSSADDDAGYTAAQLSGAALLEGIRAVVPALQALPIEIEEVAQIDSKDMTHAVWQHLAHAVDRHLARPEVRGIVITHGTDTLEETAYFLQRVLAPTKPVVLTAAMRPATSREADGPANLRDALVVAGEPGARGVVAVLAGQVWNGLALRKLHTHSLRAFGASEGGLVAQVMDGVVRPRGAWPDGEPLGLSRVERDAAHWPVVDVVLSHAGVRAVMVDAAVASGARGVVVAGTGNGTVHRELEAALQRAAAQGARVVRATRCAEGAVQDAPNTPVPAFAAAGLLSPVQARIELMLALMQAE
jgi:L-asparaginase